MPASLLEPVADVFRQLTSYYGCSIVLCTATQPALKEGPFRKVLPEVREIVPDPQRYFSALKRVEYQVYVEEPWDWPRVAEEVRPYRQCLVVVNTRGDARELVACLDDPDTLHLSTLLCPAHRRDVLQEIQHRLKAGDPCRLVATQVVEAGVDLDFPAVFRALGPLDRIVQAAGRCNREGRLKTGRVIIFSPARGRVPPGEYRTATDQAALMLRSRDLDLHDPRVYTDYFRRVYQGVELDAKKVQQYRKEFNYPEVARRFRLIDDDSVSVVVPYRTRSGDGPEKLLVRAKYALSRQLFRQLQPFIVGVKARELPGLQKECLVREVCPGLYEWLGSYDSTMGIASENRDPEDLVI